MLTFGTKTYNTIYKKFTEQLDIYQRVWEVTRKAPEGTQLVICGIFQLLAQVQNALLQTENRVMGLTTKYHVKIDFTALVKYFLFMAGTKEITTFHVTCVDVTRARVKFQVIITPAQYSLDRQNCTLELLKETFLEPNFTTETTEAVFGNTDDAFPMQKWIEALNVLGFNVDVKDMEVSRIEETPFDLTCVYDWTALATFFKMKMAIATVSKNKVPKNPNKPLRKAVRNAYTREEWKKQMTRLTLLLKMVNSSDMYMFFTRNTWTIDESFCTIADGTFNPLATLMSTLDSNLQQLIEKTEEFDTLGSPTRESLKLAIESFKKFMGVTHTLSKRRNAKPPTDLVLPHDECKHSYFFNMFMLYKLLKIVNKTNNEELWRKLAGNLTESGKWAIICFQTWAPVQRDCEAIEEEKTIKLDEDEDDEDDGSDSDDEDDGSDSDDEDDDEDESSIILMPDTDEDEDPQAADAPPPDSDSDEDLEGYIEMYLGRYPDGRNVRAPRPPDENRGDNGEDDGSDSGEDGVETDGGESVDDDDESDDEDDGSDGDDEGDDEEPLNNNGKRGRPVDAACSPSPKRQQGPS